MPLGLVSMYTYSAVILLWDILVLPLEDIFTQNAILIDVTCTQQYKFSPFSTSQENGNFNVRISSMAIVLFKLYDVNNYPFLKIGIVIVTVFM